MDCLVPGARQYISADVDMSHSYLRLARSWRSCVALFAAGAPTHRSVESASKHRAQRVAPSALEPRGDCFCAKRDWRHQNIAPLGLFEPSHTALHFTLLQYVHKQIHPIANFDSRWWKIRAVVLFFPCVFTLRTAAQKNVVAFHFLLGFPHTTYHDNFPVEQCDKYQDDGE